MWAALYRAVCTSSLTALQSYRAGTPLTWLPRPGGRGKVFDAGFSPRAVVDAPQEKGSDPKPIKLITH